MVVYPVCVTDWAWRACGVVHQNYCSCCVLKVTRWKSAYQALNTCVQMQCLRTTALFNFGRSAQFASLWKAPPLFMTTEGSGPLIQMFLGWKILTDKCSPLSILWEVVFWLCYLQNVINVSHGFCRQELNYRLYKLQDNLTNFSATFGLYYSSLWSAVFERGSKPEACFLFVGWQWKNRFFQKFLNLFQHHGWG